MYKNFNDGMIEIITGPMFSGKSEELLKKIRILEYAKLKPLVIKPTFDNRFSDDSIVSRAGTKNKTFTIKEPKEIYELLLKDKYKAILIDEAHFFDKSLVNIADDLANKGYLIIIAGLDQNYLREPFGPMPELMAIAERITKLQAICVKCQHAASTSFRIVKSDKEHLLGDVSEYEARCRKCHYRNIK
ncbi:thymidine kinase [Mycoplasma phocoeninasale]|uniref:Thymidine kinase n=1 Tax=Mycoplasma phocoeninasale TaxID=2726117 RepID=A0A858U4Q4_9MOLU|nr:thymidine kinase [Mycoplasma phocoeninasale]MBN0970678.1 thymidine kinase [Mycoplasma phocoeninasale]QJG66213.1 thymidine kinase [Mycoplasma phocoeninasale]